HNRTAKAQEITLSATLPAGWTVENGTGKFMVAAKQTAAAQVEVSLPAPDENPAEKTSKKTEPQHVTSAGGANVQAMGQPRLRGHCRPSITTHSPLMCSAMSLRRNAARLASSSGRPKRFIGCFSLLCSSNCFEGIRRDHAPSVGKGPGAMALIRM